MDVSKSSFEKQKQIIGTISLITEERAALLKSNSRKKLDMQAKSVI